MNPLAKILSIVAICSTGYETQAHAQSSVTLYGMADTGLRYETHANTAGNSALALSTGGESASLLGIQGEEDLGGGYRAVFLLENQFFLNTGQNNPYVPYDNRSYVGLDSTQYGQLTMGRQRNPVVDAMLQTFVSNSWIPSFYAFRPEAIMVGGIWTDNMVKYASKWKDVTMELSYALGGVAGHTSDGGQLGASLTYAPNGPFQAAAGYLDSSDPQSGAQGKIWVAGATYTLYRTRLNLGYLANRLDANFTSFGIYTEAELAALKYLDMASRQMFMLGITQTVGARSHLSFNFWRTLQTGKTTAQNGTASQFQIVADYGLSRRTTVYAEVDDTHAAGDLIGAQIQGANAIGSPAANQLGAMVGIRHAF